MKLNVTVAVSGDATRRLADRARILSAGSARRLEHELETELQSLARSERAADPESRRDALERAVRRIWGATL
jgi:hypothetical protein